MKLFLISRETVLMMVQSWWCDPGDWDWAVVWAGLTLVWHWSWDQTWVAGSAQPALLISLQHCSTLSSLLITDHWSPSTIIITNLILSLRLRKSSKNLLNILVHIVYQNDIFEFIYIIRKKVVRKIVVSLSNCPEIIIEQYWRHDAPTRMFKDFIVI